VIRFGKYRRKLWNDWENMEITLNSEELEKTEENCEKIGKYGWNVKWHGKYGRKVSWKVKRFGKCGRKVGWIMKWYEKYGRNPSWIVIRFGKYRRKLRNDGENMEGKLKSEKSWKIQKKIVKR
jgi:hypothetical protein